MTCALKSGTSVYRGEVVEVQATNHTMNVKFPFSITSNSRKTLCM